MALWPLLAIALVLSACGESVAHIPAERLSATPSPTTIPTASVGFEVAVTPMPVRRRRQATARRPSPPHIPAGPYLILQPWQGAPVETRIAIAGGHFPASIAVELFWRPLGRATFISFATASNRRGTFTTSLTIPASPPGLYQLEADVHNVPTASATFVVDSRAVITAQVTTTAEGEHILVEGKHFMPHLRLTLVAIPLGGSTRVTLIAHTHSGIHGRFRVDETRSLASGQYILRALPANTKSMQSAETFFNVVA